MVYHKPVWLSELYDLQKCALFKLLCLIGRKASLNEKKKNTDFLYLFKELKLSVHFCDYVILK